MRYDCCLLFLLRVKLHQKKELEKLNNLPRNFEKYFYKNWNKEINGTFGLDFRQKILSEAPKEVVKIYFLTTKEFGREIQSDIDLYITRDRLNKASFKRK